jgi:hypothetical protein
MGCGETLELHDGRVMCIMVGCLDYLAVDRILADPETEHVVEVDETGFSVQHPLRERVGGMLFQCDLHSRLKALGDPPKQPGRYRALAAWDLTRL